MGKTQTQAKERRKALAGRKQYVQEPLSDFEIIADCKARIRLCESDMKRQGQNNVVQQKIDGFKVDIEEAESRIAIENQNITKEVNTNDD